MASVAHNQADVVVIGKPNSGSNLVGVGHLDGIRRIVA